MIKIGESEKDVISFDLATLIDTRLLIEGNSGGGKSYAIRRLLEQSHGQVQQIVLDLEGEFSTLRVKYDYIIAGKNGDTPANPSSAKLLARKILELNVSVICDLYELKYHDRITFVRYFLESMMAAPRELWHPALVVIDEAHHFASQHGEVESYAAVIDLCPRGRKRGFCAILATQRLSKLHKDACAELLNKMIGRTSLDIDQARAGDELGLIGKQDRVALRNLNPGEFHIYGPALRKNKQFFNGVILAKVGEVISRHPKVGARQLDAPPKPTTRIKEILGKLADLPAEAQKESQDLASLKKENAQLKREISLKDKGQPVVKICNHGPEIAELKNQIRKTDKLVIDREKSLRALSKYIDQSLSGVLKKVQVEICGEIEQQINLPRQPHDHSNIQRTIPRLVPVPKVQREPIDPEAGISKSQQKILNVLAAFENLGLDKIHKNMLAAHSGVSPTSGGYFNNLGRLRSLGYIEYPDSLYACLTDMGRELAQAADPITGIDDLHQSWYRILPDSQAKILKKLIEIYPEDISKDELAEIVEVSPTSGGYFNNLGRLRTLGAVTYPSGGRVKASELLFPEGLR